MGTHIEGQEDPPQALQDLDDGRGKPTFAYVSSFQYGVPRSSPIGISVFKLDPGSGALELVGTVNDEEPTWVAVDPTGRYLHACFPCSDGGQPTSKVAAYAIDDKTGMLRLLNEASLGENAAPAQITLTQDGRYAIVASYYTGRFLVLQVENDGRCGPVTDVVTGTGRGPHPHQEAPHPHCVQLDPNGRFLGTADLGTDTLTTFRISGGTLERVSDVSTAPGMGPRHIAFGTDSRTVYAIGEISGTIAAYAYDAETGAIGECIQTISTAPPDFTGEPDGAEITVHPSGDFLYASNRGPKTVAAFRIDRETGELAVVGFTSEALEYPSNFAIDPSGRWLYVNSNRANEVVTFEIDAQTGELTPTGRTAAVLDPWVMAIRPPR
jgi:6-phosphogluconolactonase